MEIETMNLKLCLRMLLEVATHYFKTRHCLQSNDSMTEVTALYKSCQLSSRVVQQELRIATTALRELVEAALG